MSFSEYAALLWRTDCLISIDACGAFAHAACVGRVNVRTRRSRWPLIDATAHGRGHQMTGSGPFFAEGFIADPTKEWPYPSKRFRRVAGANF